MPDWTDWTLESEESFPKRLFAADFKPKARLAQFSIEMRNVVGAMREQTQTIAKHRVKILSGFHDAPSLVEKGIWSFFADFAEADIEPEALASELRSNPSVLNVRCQSVDDGFITDTLHFPVMLSMERAIIVRSAVIVSMIDRIKALFGIESESAHVILHQVGEAGGLSEFDSVKALTGVDFIRKNVARTFNLYSALGYGISNLTALDFERRTVEIHVKDGFECVRSTNPSGVPQGHFTRGLISGWFSRLFESKIDVVETRCVAKGDPDCVFQVQPFKG
jgi:predicted hydrocarbon binding protein